MSETKVITGKVRFSYAHVWKPSSIGEDGPKKYSVSIIIPKDDTATLPKVEAAIQAAYKLGISKSWGGKQPSSWKTPLRDGDVDRPDNEEYANSWFINANSTTAPQIVGKDRKLIHDEAEFYSGCYGRASVNFYSFFVSGNKGVACGLNNLQKLEDGEPLGEARSTAADDFGAPEDDDFM